MVQVSFEIDNISAALISTKSASTITKETLGTTQDTKHITITDIHQTLNKRLPIFLNPLILLSQRLIKSSPLWIMAYSYTWSISIIKSCFHH